MTLAFGSSDAGPYWVEPYMVDEAAEFGYPETGPNGVPFCSEAHDAFGSSMYEFRDYYVGSLSFFCLDGSGDPVFLGGPGQFYEMTRHDNERPPCGDAFGQIGASMGDYYMGGLQFQCLDGSGYPLFADNSGHFFSLNRLESDEVDETNEPLEEAMDTADPASSDPALNRGNAAADLRQSSGPGVVVVENGDAYWSDPSGQSQSGDSVDAKPISSDNVGSALAPVAFGDLPTRIDGTGGVTLDLTHLDLDTFDGSFERVAISHANGNVTVLVPGWMSISGQASIANGELSIFGDESEGPLATPFERTNGSNLMITLDVELVGGTFAVAEG